MKPRRVLILAIAFSAIWHVFWLSAFKVVIVPKAARPVKFSGVSFLGPILDTSALSVSAPAHIRSAAEERYLSVVGKPSSIARERFAEERYTVELIGEPDFAAWSPDFNALAIAALDTGKAEPPHDY